MCRRLQGRRGVASYRSGWTRIATATPTRTWTGHGLDTLFDTATNSTRTCDVIKANRDGDGDGIAIKAAKCVRDAEGHGCQGCKTISKTDNCQAIPQIFNEIEKQQDGTSITKCNCCIINLYDAQLLSTR